MDIFKQAKWKKRSGVVLFRVRPLQTAQGSTLSWTAETCTRGADKSLALPTSRCILFDDENISFDSSLVMYI